MTDHIVEKIATETGCGIKDIQKIVAVALRELDFIAYTDRKATTGALEECFFSFGVEACFHLCGILTCQDDCTNEPGQSLMPETLNRMLGTTRLKEVNKQWEARMNSHQEQLFKNTEESNERVKISVKGASHQVAWEASHQAGKEAAKKMGEGGLCGFAWIIVKPGTSSFARWLVKTDRGSSDRYYGGVHIGITEYGQFLGQNEEYANSFARELQKYYPSLDISPMTKLD